ASIFTQKIIRNWCRKPVVMQTYYVKNSTFIRICGARQILPWQTNSIFIIVLFLLVLPQNALFCKDFLGYDDML
ncbi:hypothetical protein, partial [Waltera sp.]|uniref:hypothetical protein n=1 Tax=Waltera sp. TaxID=2815806 RepID=UPI003AB4DF7E